MNTSNTRRWFASLAALATGGLIGCGSRDDSSPSSANLPSLPDLGVAATVKEELTFTTGSWTWVSGDPANVGFPMSCMDGTPTGFGINIPTNWNHKVMFWLDGGGLCYDQTTCASTNVVPHANRHSYGLTDFNNDVGYDTTSPNHTPVLFPNTGEPNWDPSQVATYPTFTWTKSELVRGVFDRTSATNPFYNWAFVFIPYCTGDLHVGYKYDCAPGTSGCTNTPVSGRTPSSPYPWKLGLYDANYAYAQVMQSPSLPNISQVVLAGGSAGGFGAVYTYRYLRFWTPSAVHITVISDAGDPLWTGTPSTSNPNSWSGPGGRQGFLLRENADGTQRTPPAPGVPSYMEDLWADSWGISASAPIAPIQPSGSLGPMYPVQSIWNWNAANNPNDKFGLIAGEDDFAYSWLIPLNGPNAGISPWQNPSGTDGMMPSVHFGLIDFVFNGVLNHGNTSDWRVDSRSRPPNSTACQPSCQALRPLWQNHTYLFSDTTLWGSMLTIPGGGNGALDYFTDIGITRQ